MPVKLVSADTSVSQPPPVNDLQRTNSNSDRRLDNWKGVDAETKFSSWTMISLKTGQKGGQLYGGQQTWTMINPVLWPIL